MKPKLSLVGNRKWYITVLLWGNNNRTGGLVLNDDRAIYMQKRINKSVSLGLRRPTSRWIRRCSETAKAATLSFTLCKSYSRRFCFLIHECQDKCLLHDTPIGAHVCYTQILGALPIVPQVHRTFFNFAKDFEAALQLCPGAVGPQSPHVHHPSLLLLVTKKDREEKED